MAVELVVTAFVVEIYNCLFCNLTFGKYDNSCVAVLREIWTKSTAALRELLYLTFSWMVMYEIHEINRQTTSIILHRISWRSAIMLSSLLLVGLPRCAFPFKHSLFGYGSLFESGNFKHQKVRGNSCKDVRNMAYGSVGWTELCQGNVQFHGVIWTVLNLPWKWSEGISYKVEPHFFMHFGTSTTCSSTAVS